MVQKIGVVGAGQMGNGIAQVAAAAGYDVTLVDIKQEFVDGGLSNIEKNLGRMVAKEKISQSDADAARARVVGSTANADLADCDLVIEAIIENELSLIHI